jgi:hypothetical protein
LAPSRDMTFKTRIQVFQRIQPIQFEGVFANIDSCEMISEFISLDFLNFVI